MHNHFKLRGAGWLASLVVVAGGSVVFAGEPAPVPAPQPKPPQPVITVKADNTTAPVDLNPAFADFQSADPAKQEAATKILIDSGARGYAMLGNLLNNKDAALVKRATEARQQIEQRSWKMFQEVAAQAEKLQKVPLTTQALEDLRQSYLKMTTYTPQHALRQHGFQSATDLQKRIKEVDEAGKALALHDAQLKAEPAPQGILLASIQMDRAKALKTLQRLADASKAAETAAAASGPSGRLTPQALKLQAELLSLLEDNKTHELICRQLIQQYPSSLEVKYGYSALISALAAEKRWDEAVKLAQDFVIAFPVDDTAQESLYSLLTENLMDEQHDYPRVKALAEWVQAKLPVDRWTVEIPKLIGGCNEYIAKDYPKAEKAYRELRAHFPDIFSPADMDLVLQRVQDKAQGKFPKEPAETDEGIAGVLGKFLKAIRTRDAKAISALVPAEEAEDYVTKLTEGGEEIIALVTFADFIVKKIEPNKEGTEAEITLDLYDAASSKPRTMVQQAVKQENSWRIQWDVAKLSAEEQPQPAPQIVVPAQNKKVPPQNQKFSTETKQKE